MCAITGIGTATTTCWRSSDGCAVEKMAAFLLEFVLTFFPSLSWQIIVFGSNTLRNVAVSAAQGVKLAHLDTAPNAGVWCARPSPHTFVLACDWLTHALLYMGSGLKW